ncbi:hypothetical protein NDU88_009440 [Pleurodeles waltl]|uniref:Uncharacterized protein n=1 Tax=Pleurodeles waltl TaxID=8319 RepID=A0AAV7QRN0_PLEWA|nr:hypothetical protein NDU88_009440 [Pleurodeles waltl]
MPSDILGVEPRIKGSRWGLHPSRGERSSSLHGNPEPQWWPLVPAAPIMWSKWSQPASHGSVAVSGRAHRVERGPQARGLGAGEQAPPHLRRRLPPRPGRRVKSLRVGNPSVAPDAAALALEVPRRVGPSRKGPGSTGLGGRAQDRCRPHGTRNAAVGFSQSSAGIPELSEDQEADDQFPDCTATEGPGHDGEEELLPAAGPILLRQPVASAPVAQGGETRSQPGRYKLRPNPHPAKD